MEKPEEFSQETIASEKGFIDGIIERDVWFRTIVQTADEGIVIARPDGNYFFVNERMAEMLGYNQEEILGKSSIDFMYGNSRDAVCTARKDLNGGRSLRGEFKFRRKDGSILWTQYSATPVFDSQERHVANFAMHTDITLRKQAEEEREHLIRKLEQKNAELERFTYTVSHELKSPLVTMRGFLNYLQNDLQQKKTDYLETDVARISSAVREMQDLLSEIVELSKIGLVVHPPELANLGDIAREAVKELESSITEQEATVLIDPALPDVWVDRIQAREILVNLIENAIKYRGDNPAPGIWIGQRADQDPTVFFVKDNGIGIDPRYLTRIFNLFEKLDPHTEGSGIGLAIVKRIVEVHGGTVWAESEGHGKGSTFCFTLPGLSE